MQTETRFTARYAETDQMGIVHHSNYAVWFEAGRTDFLKKAGVSNTDIEARGILLPLYEMNCQFKNPAGYEDGIMVITSMKQISRVRLCFSYKVLNAANHKLLGYICVSFLHIFRTAYRYQGSNTCRKICGAVF